MDEKQPGLNWLTRTQEVPAVTQDLLARYGKELDSLCSGDAYGLFRATLAVGLANGLAEAFGPNSRKGRVVGPKILAHLLNAMPVAYVVALEQGKAGEQ